MPVAGAAGESKDLVVESPAALIPEILGRGKLQPVEIGAQLPFWIRAIDELHEAVFEVHQVVDREPGVAARSGQEFDKGAVFVVVWVIVAGAAKPAAAQPGRRRNVSELVAAFDGIGARMLVEISPLPVLQNTPSQQVELPRPGGYAR